MHTNNKITIGSDHGGFALKERIKAMLIKDGFEVEDVGTHSEESTDYPDYARAVAHKVAKHSGRGILVCGTGIGMSIAANKVDGIRAAVIKDVNTAELARKHNDANIACLGERTTDPIEAEKIVKSFLSTDFEGGRHERRVHKIEEIEKAS